MKRSPSSGSCVWHGSKDGRHVYTTDLHTPRLVRRSREEPGWCISQRLGLKLSTCLQRWSQKKSTPSALMSPESCTTFHPTRSTIVHSADNLCVSFLPGFLHFWHPGIHLAVGLWGTKPYHVKAQSEYVRAVVWALSGRCLGYFDGHLLLQFWSLLGLDSKWGVPGSVFQNTIRH